MYTSSELTILVEKWNDSVLLRSAHQSDLESKVCRAVQEIFGSFNKNRKLLTETLQVLKQANFTTPLKRGIYSAIFGERVDSKMADVRIESVSDLDGLDKLVAIEMVCSAVQKIFRAFSRKCKLVMETVQVLKQANFTSHQKRSIYAAIFGGDVNCIIVENCIKSAGNFEGLDKFHTLEFDDGSIEISEAELKGIGGYFKSYAYFADKFLKKSVIEGLTAAQFNNIHQYYLGKIDFDFEDPDTWLYMRALTDRFHLVDLIEAIPDLPSFKTVKKCIKFVKNNHLTVLDFSQFRNSITNGHLKKIQTLINLEILVIHSERISDAGLKRLVSLKKLKVLDLSSFYRITDAGLIHLGKLTALTQLCLHWCGITDTGLSHLANLKKLKVLDLSACKGITDAGLIHLANLTELEVLDLEQCCRVRGAGLIHLAKLNKLTELNLVECNRFTNAGLIHLADLIELKVLELSSCWQITDAGLIHLVKLNKLKGLYLDSCRGVTDGGLIHLVRLKKLTNLELAECDRITDDGLLHLANLTELEELGLNSCKRITDAGLSYLPNLIKLTVLNLAKCFRITNAGLSDLAKLIKLKVLDLSSCDRITDDGLVHLANLTELEELDLEGCDGITDAGLRQIAKLKNLQKLKLSWCRNITDVGLRQIAKLKMLQELELYGCYSIAGAGLCHLANLNNLKQLKLYWGTQITSSAADSFKLRGVKVIKEWLPPY